MSGKVYPDYHYTGVCQEYATAGRVKGGDYNNELKGAVIQTIDLSAPKIFYYGADRDTDNDPKQKADTDTFELSRPLKYKGVRALHLSGVAAAKNHPSVNPAEPNPYIGGLGIGYSRAPKDLRQATHVQIKVFPRTSASLIVEIYENDGGNPRKIDKNPKNFYLPKKDDDFYKLVIKLQPTGKWQTLTIPLSKFVDWNKKITCLTPIPGINQNVGNNKFDPKKGEALDFQLTFVSDNWGPEVKDIYIANEVKFIKIKK